MPILKLPGSASLVLGGVDSPLRLLLNTALDAVVVMNAQGVITHWNAPAVELFGWSAEDAVGRTVAELIIPRRYRDAHFHGLERYLSTGDAAVLGRRIEIEGLRKSGEEFPVELSIATVEEAERVYFVGFLRDITARKSSECLHRAIAGVSRAASLAEALHACLASVHELTGWPIGHVYVRAEAANPVLMSTRMWWCDEPAHYRPLIEVTEAMKFAPGEGLPGRVWEQGSPIWIEDVERDLTFPRARVSGGVGIKSALAFPIKAGNEVFGVVEFFSQFQARPSDALVRGAQVIGEQIGSLLERQRAAEHREFLLVEVNHRVKNMLAVVSGIATQTIRSSLDLADFKVKFLARLQALAKVHTLLAQGDWKATSMQLLVREFVLPHASDEQRLRMSGPPVELPPKASLAFAMILHELATNAAKYGAFAAPAGSVTISWESTDGWLRVGWRENGLGRTPAPGIPGFGSKLIETGIRHELGGETRLSYEPGGLTYEFRWPADR